MCEDLEEKLETHPIEESESSTASVESDDSSLEISYASRLDIVDSVSMKITSKLRK